MYLTCWSISNINESTNPPHKHRYFSVLSTFTTNIIHYNIPWLPATKLPSGSQMLGKLFNLSTPRKVWGYWRENSSKRTACFDCIHLCNIHAIFIVYSHHLISHASWPCHGLWMAMLAMHTPIADMHLQKTHVNWIKSWAFATEPHWTLRSMLLKGSRCSSLPPQTYRSPRGLSTPPRKKTKAQT